MVTRNKYGAKKITINGEKFDSKGEFQRWSFLLLMQQQGKISKLERQVTFEFELNKVEICKYIADFVYFDQNGEKVVEDFKGVITDTFRIKRKMMKAFHGIDVCLSKAAGDPITIRELL